MRFFKFFLSKFVKPKGKRQTEHEIIVLAEATWACAGDDC